MNDNRDYRELVESYSEKMTAYAVKTINKGIVFVAKLAGKASSALFSGGLLMLVIAVLVIAVSGSMVLISAENEHAGEDISSSVNEVIFDNPGFSIDNSELVNIAINELGNTGGAKYYKWYGFKSETAWCACFVSYCCVKAHLDRAGQFQKFCLCRSGMSYFIREKRFIDRSKEPKSGMIVFYDRKISKGVLGQDGKSDHVGIVEKADEKYIYTIEGNWGNKVTRRKVSRQDKTIMGYGFFAL